SPSKERGPSLAGAARPSATDVAAPQEAATVNGDPGRRGTLLLPTLLFGLYLMASAAGGVLLVVACRTFSLTAGYAAGSIFAAVLFCPMPMALARLMVCRPEGVGLSIAFSVGLTLAGLGLGMGAAGSLLVPVLGMRGSLLMGVALAGLAAGGSVLVRQRGIDCPGALGAVLSGGEIPAGDPSWAGEPGPGG